jgi:hypothetical protein
LNASIQLIPAQAIFQSSQGVRSSLAEIVSARIDEINTFNRGQGLCMQNTFTLRRTFALPTHATTKAMSSITDEEYRKLSAFMAKAHWENRQARRDDTRLCALASVASSLLKHDSTAAAHVRTGSKKTTRMRGPKSMTGITGVCIARSGKYRAVICECPTKRHKMQPKHDPQ